jgi:hypothetical protein
MEKIWEIAPLTIRLDVGEATRASEIVSEWKDTNDSAADLYSFDAANDRCEINTVHGDMAKGDVLKRITKWLEDQAAVRKYLVNVNEWSDRVEVRNRVSDHAWAAQSEPYVAVQRSPDEYAVMGRTSQQIAKIYRRDGHWHGNDLLTKSEGVPVEVGPYSSPVDAFEALLVAGGWVTPE